MSQAKDRAYQNELAKYLPSYPSSLSSSSSLTQLRTNIPADKQQPSFLTDNQHSPLISSKHLSSTSAIRTSTSSIKKLPSYSSHTFKDNGLISSPKVVLESTIQEQNKTLIQKYLSEYEDILYGERRSPTINVFNIKLESSSRSKRRSSRNSENPGEKQPKANLFQKQIIRKSTENRKRKNHAKFQQQYRHRCQHSEYQVYHHHQCSDDYGFRRQNIRCECNQRQSIQELKKELEGCRKLIKKNKKQMKQLVKAVEEQSLARSQTQTLNTGYQKQQKNSIQHPRQSQVRFVERDASPKNIHISKIRGDMSRKQPTLSKSKKTEEIRVFNSIEEIDRHSKAIHMNNENQMNPRATVSSKKILIFGVQKSRDPISRDSKKSQGERKVGVFRRIALNGSP